MGYRITVDSRIRGKIRVTGWPTSNKHVWVTRCLDDPKKYAITHRPSGRALMVGLKSLEMADFAWDLAKKFPVDWSRPSPDMGKFKPVLKALFESFQEVA